MRKTTNNFIINLKQDNSDSSFIEGVDSSLLSKSSLLLFPVAKLSKDPFQLLTKLSTQFINQNRKTLDLFNVEASTSFFENEVKINFKTNIKIGAFSLISPTSGKADYGFIIKPRFGWSGLGPLLCDMGWKIRPDPLTNLQFLPRSDKKIPAWVLSSIILFRIKDMLEKLTRKFKTVENILSSPRGKINWNEYSQKNISRMKFLDIPCSYSELACDADLQSAIHYVLIKHLRSLETQKTSGMVVIKLIEICQLLISKVRNVAPGIPSEREIHKWLSIPMRNNILYNGVEAIRWTIDEKGFAGLSDLRGIPWILSMEEFFEAWLETIVKKLSHKIGGTVRTGRERQTIYPISWNPPYAGSQKYLLPDIILDKEDEVYIFDAKYKEHFEEFQQHGWHSALDKTKEYHREDILQILAYSTLFENKKINVCLAYPCNTELWDSLKSRDRLFHTADITNGVRNVKLILTAIPMNHNVDEITEVLKFSLNKIN